VAGNNPVPVSPGSPALLRWGSLGDGLVVSLLFAGLTLFAGYVLRDQREEAWKALFVVAAAGLLGGGAIAGRHRRAKKGAIAQGAAVGFLTATVATLAEVIRCLVLLSSVSGHTTELSVGVEVSATAIGAMGALMGRRSYIRHRKRRRMRT
jgi:hypothetical protein